MYQVRMLRVAIISSAVIVSAQAALGETIYVKWDATGAKCGHSLRSGELIRIDASELIVGVS